MAKTLSKGAKQANASGLKGAEKNGNPLTPAKDGAKRADRGLQPPKSPMKSTDLTAPPGSLGSPARQTQNSLTAGTIAVPSTTTTNEESSSAEHPPGTDDSGRYLMFSLFFCCVNYVCHFMCIVYVYRSCGCIAYVYRLCVKGILI